MAKDLEGARAGFAGLSHSVEALVRRFGNPLEQALNLVLCPMAMGSAGASWLQQGSDIDNSYFGEAMRSCGEVKQEVAPGAYLRETEVTPQAKRRLPAGGHQH
jgi:Cu(I)/Ag(I) efflux system membrane fusion protein